MKKGKTTLKSLKPWKKHAVHYTQKSGVTKLVNDVQSFHCMRKMTHCSDIVNNTYRCAFHLNI